MSKAIVQAGQTLEDIAIQYLGSEQAVFELASINSLELTADLSAGQQLELPDVYDKQVRRVYERGGYQPAAGGDADLQGINYWIIEQNFIVQ
jgi:LysM repeat protein